MVSPGSGTFARAGWRAGRLSGCGEAELAEYVVDVGVNGSVSDDEFGGDLSVGLSARDELGDLALSRRQGNGSSRSGVVGVIFSGLAA